MNEDQEYFLDLKHIDLGFDSVFLFKWLFPALAGVAQLVGHRPQGESLAVWFWWGHMPGWQVPSPGHLWETTHQCFSLTWMCLAFSFSFPYPLSKNNFLKILNNFLHSCFSILKSQVFWYHRIFWWWNNYEFILLYTDQLKYYYNYHMAYLKIKIFFSVTVDLQYYISFKGTAQLLDIYIPYQAIPPIHLAPTWHHT